MQQRPNTVDMGQAHKLCPINALLSRQPAVYTCNKNPLLSRQGSQSRRVG